ncbi:MAG: hypothetical protein M1837_004097 [Sclerophora amabilis]|nr:MAG: hypothetical protein M1837_004097 [Sclerophora amabilis]
MAVKIRPRKSFFFPIRLWPYHHSLFLEHSKRIGVDRGLWRAKTVERGTVEAGGAYHGRFTLTEAAYHGVYAGKAGLRAGARGDVDYAADSVTPARHNISNPRPEHGGRQNRHLTWSDPQEEPLASPGASQKSHNNKDRKRDRLAHTSLVAPIEESPGKDSARPRAGPTHRKTRTARPVRSLLRDEATSSTTQEPPNAQPKAPPDTRNVTGTLPPPPPPHCPSQTGSTSSSVSRRTKAKRAPASWSSLGIETASGPPPALSFQRSCSSEAVRRAFTLTEFALAQQQLPLGPSRDGEGGRCSPDYKSKATDNDRESLSTSDSTDTAGDRNNLLDRVSSEEDKDPCVHTRMKARDGHYYGEDLLEDDRDRTLRALEGFPGDADNAYVSSDERKAFEEEPQSEHNRTGSDDLFLNLAKSQSKPEGTEEASRRSERRRSRIALASHRTSTPMAPFQASATPKSTPAQERVAMPSRIEPSDDEWGHVQSLERAQERSSASSSSLPVRRIGSPSVSAHPLDESSSRSRFLENAPHGSVSAPREAPKSAINAKAHQLGAHRQSLPDASTANPYRSHRYRQSNLSYTFPQNPSGPPPPPPPPLDRAGVSLDQDASPSTPRVDGTESTVSTTAPSTVWDELDDLKSRIRKLELTGKLPSSSGAAMSNASGDRPRTATTTVTTVSSSPKQGRLNSVSPSESGIGGSAAANVHPLLHASLAKSRTLLDAEVYRALETTASDALSLAALMGGSGIRSSGASAIGYGVPPDRQIRRKAESMCRSLTELSIALCDEKTGSAPAPSRHNSTVHPRHRDSSTVYTSLDGAADIDHGQPYHRPYHHHQNTMDSTPNAVTTLARSSSRALNRAEARRSSLISLSQHANYSPQGPDASTNTPMGNTPYTPTANSNSNSNSNSSRHLSRASTVLFRNRADLSYSNPNTPDDHSPSPPHGYRAPSRAATDIISNKQSNRRSARYSSPREYTSNYPLPNSTSRSPSVASSSLPLLRYHQHQHHQPHSSISNNGITPAGDGDDDNNNHHNNTPPTMPGNASSIQRRYLDRNSPASNTGGGGSNGYDSTPPPSMLMTSRAGAAADEKSIRLVDGAAAGGGNSLVNSRSRTGSFVGRSTTSSAAAAAESNVTRRLRMRQEQQYHQQQQQQQQQQEEDEQEMQMQLQMQMQMAHAE